MRNVATRNGQITIFVNAVTFDLNVKVKFDLSTFPAV